MNSKNNNLYFNIIKKNKVDSTMNLCFNEVLNKKDSENILVVSKTQTNSRGTNNRNWDSQIGGLWFSFETLNIANIQILISIILYEVLKKYNPEIKIKWLNDIYFKDYKLAGILCEKHFIDNKTITICGIGININNEINSENKTINLKNILNKKEDLEIEKILKDFILIYEKTIKNPSKILKDFDLKNITFNLKINYKNKLLEVISINQNFSLKVKNNSNEIFNLNYEDIN